MNKKKRGSVRVYYIFKSWARIRHAGYGLISYINRRVVRGVITKDAFLALANVEVTRF